MALCLLTASEVSSSESTSSVQSRESICMVVGGLALAQKNGSQEKTASVLLDRRTGKHPGCFQQHSEKDGDLEGASKWLDSYLKE